MCHLLRQEKLAFAFRDHMTRGQSLQGSNDYRRRFYEEVINPKFLGLIRIALPESRSIHWHDTGSLHRDAGHSLSSLPTSLISSRIPHETKCGLLPHTWRIVIDFPIFSLFEGIIYSLRRHGLISFDDLGAFPAKEDTVTLDRVVQMNLVGRHMRLCIAATTGFDRLVSGDHCQV
ncbi:hypothetical protein BJV78DRAFT_744305 [Lactifluus subvellereus]|nr:hypothetical protein BJV78DRAFT_744305 [Lactifluus subvellereus]